MKKLLSFLLVLSFLVPTNIVFAQDDERTVDSFLPIDIDDHWGIDALVDFVDAGILKGTVVDSDVYLHPNKNITRAEVAALLVRSLELEDDGTGTTFPDVPQGNWAENYLKIASAHGIIKGSGGKALPNKPIKRDELAAMIVRAFAATVNFNQGDEILFSDVRSDYWATEYVNKASKVGIVQGYAGKTYSPSKNATRAETVVMLGRALQLEIGDLATDQELIDQLINGETAAYDLLNAGDFEALFIHNKTYYTGFQRAYANDSVDLLLSIEDVKLTLELTQPLAAEVVSKTDRFAVVKMTSGEVQFSVKIGSSTLTDTQPVEGLYYMRKVHGEWLIYYTDIEPMLPLN